MTNEPNIPPIETTDATRRPQMPVGPDAVEIKGTGPRERPLKRQTREIDEEHDLPEPDSTHDEDPDPVILSTAKNWVHDIVQEYDLRPIATVDLPLMFNITIWYIDEPDFSKEYRLLWAVISYGSNGPQHSFSTVGQGVARTQADAWILARDVYDRYH